MPTRAADDQPPDPVRGVDPRMPWQALVAVALGLIGVLPLAIVAFLVLALGGLESDGARDPWVYLTVLAPLLQLFGGMWLLLRRGRLPLLLAVLAATAMALTIMVVGRSTGEPVAVGPLILVVCPLLAAGFAVSPPVGRWLAAVRGEPRRPRG